MIDDHKRIGDDMMSALSSFGAAEPAATLDPKHQKLMDRLDKYAGKDFDKHYISIQLDAHDDAISLFSDYAKNGDNPALKNFAAHILPVIQQHREHAAQIKSAY